MIVGGLDDASEIECYKCRFVFNDIGWTASGFNSLNFVFVHIDLLANTRGVEIGGDGTFATQVTGGLLVLGGSTALNTECDFCFGNTFDVTTIVGVRAEPGNKFVKGAANVLELRGNAVTPTGNVDDIVVDVSAVRLVLENNEFNDKVRTTNAGGSQTTIQMVGNLVREGTSGYPLMLPTSSAGLRLTLRDNRRYDSPTGASARSSTRSRPASSAPPPRTRRRTRSCAPRSTASTATPTPRASASSTCSARPASRSTAGSRPPTRRACRPAWSCWPSTTFTGKHRVRGRDMLRDEPVTVFERNLVQVLKPGERILSWQIPWGTSWKPIGVASHIEARKAVALDRAIETLCNSLRCVRVELPGRHAGNLWWLVHRVANM